MRLRAGTSRPMRHERRPMAEQREHREFALTGVLESNEAEPATSGQGRVAYQLKSDRNPHESAGQRRTRKPVRRLRPDHWFFVRRV